MRYGFYGQRSWRGNEIHQRLIIGFAVATVLRIIVNLPFGFWIDSDSSCLAPTLCRRERDFFRHYLALRSPVYLVDVNCPGVGESVREHPICYCNGARLVND